MESPEICSAQLARRGGDGLQAFFTPSGTELILTDLHYTPTKPAGCGNGSYFIQKIDIGTGRVMAEFGRSLGIRRFCVSTCGSLVAATGHDGKTRVWDALSGRQIHVIPVIGWAIAFHPHREVLAIGEEDSVTLWALGETAPLAVLKGATLWSCYDQLAFSPDGSLLAATGKTAALWALDMPLLSSPDSTVTNRCLTMPPGL
jgi:WD40 repeat protein